MSELNRRDFVVAGLSAAAITSLAEAQTRSSDSADPFRYCLNMSTIRGQELDLVGEIELAAKAGYDSIEPWMRKIDTYVKEGGSLKDLGKRIRDLGLTVESAIGFAQWIVDDDAKRAEGLEVARRDMDRLAQIGAVRIAAPPAGATKVGGLDLMRAAHRYRALLEIGDQTGVVPQVEVWGHSRNLSRLGESMFVAIESGHRKACLLPDVYHIFKGGSDFAGLKLLGGDTIQVFHINDYPATPSREDMNDSHRVYPGDGIAPLNDIFGMLLDNGSRAVLSLELFNRDYWKQDPMQVAVTGLRKTKESVQRALEARA